MNIALRKFFFLLSSFLFCLCNSSVVLAQADISSSLEYELNTNRSSIPVYVLLKSQANAKQILANSPARGLSRKAQVAAALKQMKASNQLSQAPVVERLRSMAEVSNVRSRWIVNLIGFEASPQKIREIATYPEVDAIYYDQPWEVEQALEEEAATVVPNGKEPGLSAVNADKMWALGYTGFGGVAFTADTGVDPFHPALNHKYAGYDGRAGTWYDFNPQITFPFDCGDHGTHVTGTILGVDRIEQDTIGVAFNAHWLGGAILCGIGTADNIGAFEWAIDPDGDFETDSDRPVVINNSWRDPSIEGEECTSTNPYPTVLDNLEAAGVAVVFSAGNSGPDPETITPPHNYNAGLVNAFTVGALNQSSTGIANFSSRGPALCLRDSVPLDIKPEVSAPGQSVRSCLPGSGYGFKSGTSMAAPHVAGAILLLNEAFPDLDGETLKLALYQSARDLGDRGEDNTFGRGIIDVFAAYNYLIAEGNTPTPPNWPDVAPMLMGINTEATQCDGKFEASFTIENQGIEEITSLTYEYAIEDQVTLVSLENISLAPEAMETFTISGGSQFSGRKDFRFRLLTANEEPVDGRLDIGGSASIVLSQIAPSSLVMDDFGPEGPCLNSPIVLSFDGTTGDSVISYFSTSITGGSRSLDSPQPFVIEELTDSTTLYGSVEYLITDGIETPDPSEVTYSAADDAEMNIFTNEAVRLRKAKVYASGSGRVTIETINTQTGGRAGRRSARVEEGLNEVELNATLEAEVPYVIKISTSLELGFLPNERVRNTSIAGGRIDITNAVGSFYLFDIESGYTDGCEQYVVELIPDTTRVSQTLAPVAIPAEVELGSQVVFSETSVASATDHRWIVDGASYEGFGDMLSITATKLGQISARVLAKDDNDCLATGVTEAEVIAASSTTRDVDSAQGIEVFPNPASTYFEINGNQTALQSITLMDAAGRVLQRWSGGQQQYNLQPLAQGAYILQLRNQENQIQTLPLVID